MNCLQKKKLAFMSIVNRVKGFLRTITGTLPLTLEGCVDEESIIDYTLYGESVQDGTPTPETPIEVESVGEFDESTGKYKIPVKVSGKNLFGNLQDKWVNTAGTITASQLGKVTQYIPCKRGDIFTISASFPTESSNNILVLSFRDVDDNNLGRYTVTKQKKLSLTKIAPTNTAYVVAGHYSNVPDWVMFEQNKTATDYEPYHEPITTNIYLDEPLGAGQSINYKKDGLPTIPTFKGTSIISADTTIQPSNAEIEYYSNVKE